VLSGFSFVIPIGLSLAIGLASGTFVSYAVVNKFLGYGFLAATALAIAHFVAGDFEVLRAVTKTFLISVLVAASVSVAAYWTGRDTLWVWSAVQSNRLAGTLLEAPPFGALLVVAFLIQTALLTAGWRVVSTTFDWLNSIVLFHAICLTFSRSSWVGLAAGLTVWAVAAFKYRQKIAMSRVVVWVTVMLIVASGTFAAGYQRQVHVASPESSVADLQASESTNVFQNFLDKMFLRQWTAMLRFTQFGEGLKLWMHRPLAGIGLGRFLVESPRWFGQPYQIHNTFIWILVEMGLIGLVWFAVMVWMIADDYAAALQIRPDRMWWVVGYAAAFASGLGFMIGNEGLYQRHLWLVIAAAAILNSRTATSRQTSVATEAVSDRPLVLQVVTRLNVGGITQQVILLARELRLHGYNAEIVTGQPGPAEGNKADQARAAGIPVMDVRRLSNRLTNPVADLLAFLALVRLFRRRRPAIVHLYMFKARVLGAVAARVAGVPFVVETLHGNLLQGYYNRVLTKVILWIERLLGWGVVDRIVAPAASQRRELLAFKIGPPDRVVVQHPGMDVSQFRELSPSRGRIRARLQIDDAAIVVGIIGRLVPIKGIDVFLEAARLVLEAYPDRVRFAIAGDGPLRAELEQLATRLSIGNRCLFLGNVNDVREFYADCDVVVLSSRNEGTPIALLEAMGARNAIVATRVGGVADMVEHDRSALLVPPNDATALARAIMALVHDARGRERLGRAALARTELFSIRQFVEGTARMYAEPSSTALVVRARQTV
jgi:glycosyltransferase involved in cell wall biosynthesis